MSKIQIWLDGKLEEPADSEEVARHIAEYMRRAGHDVREMYDINTLVIMSHWKKFLMTGEK